MFSFRRVMWVSREAASQAEKQPGEPLVHALGGRLSEQGGRKEETGDGSTKVTEGLQAA